MPEFPICYTRQAQSVFSKHSRMEIDHIHNRKQNHLFTSCYTTQCIPNHILFSSPARYGVYWHHLQRAQSSCNDSAKRQKII